MLLKLSLFSVQQIKKTARIILHNRGHNAAQLIPQFLGGECFIFKVCLSAMFALI